MIVKDIISDAVGLGACAQSSKVTNWKSLCWLFFSSQGREFCKEHDYPNIDMFRNMKPDVQPYGVWVEEDVNLVNTDAAIIGECSATLTYSGVEKAYKVILMHGAKANIHVSNYAVVLIENISGEYNVINDGIAKVLI